MNPARAALASVFLAACTRSEAGPVAVSAQQGIDSGLTEDAALRLPGSTDEVVRQVLTDLASPAFGGQSVPPECITVSPAVATRGGSVMVAGRKAEGACAGAGTNDEMWIFVRKGEGTWNEQFLGRPPVCWKGVPPEIAKAVAEASRVRLCAGSEGR